MREQQFGREYIQRELRELGEEVEADLGIYLIGGGAMSFLDLKDATKDIDVVASSSSEFSRLVEALEMRGYLPVKQPESEYEQLGASAILENEDSCRFDVFDRQVANKLVFSDGMKERADKVLESGGLTIWLTSPEDIFLFKSVAGRSTDIEDMNTLVQTGLEFGTIEEEIRTQTELIEEEVFVTHIGEALTELQEQYGVTIPLTDYVEKRSKEAYEGLEILMLIEDEGPLSTEEIVERTEVEDVSERLDRLKEMGKIRQENASWISM